MRRYNQNKSLPRNWREMLPEPEEYYRQHVKKLRGKGRWQQGLCPFHNDRNPSLGVNISSGGWVCFAGCGKGDMISFQQMLTDTSFKEAVFELLEAR